jgi:hypothetical protein
MAAPPHFFHGMQNGLHPAVFHEGQLPAALVVPLALHLGNLPADFITVRNLAHIEDLRRNVLRWL